ncbi:hypothetical protein Tco_0633110 [Tanacetum coccineum]
MNGYLHLRLMRLAKKVMGLVKASEWFREKLVKMIGEEASYCGTSCIYQGEEDQSFSIRSSLESKMACMKREVRRKASQCEEGCFKEIKGNAKENQIRGIELAVVVLN